jgi:hypothetical protein
MVLNLLRVLSHILIALQNEMEQLLRQYSINEELVAEVQRLREENERLKQAF